MQDIAKALIRAFGVTDECSNVMGVPDGLAQIAKSIRAIKDCSSEHAVQELALAIRETGLTIGNGLQAIAQAIRLTS